MPDWLRRQLEESGRLDRPGEAARSARFASCPECSSAILYGLHDDVMGLAVRADLRRLTSLDEALALLSGRWTFTVRNRTTRTGIRLQLDYRDRWQIAGKPADRPRVLVLAEHRCHQPLGGPLERLLPTPGVTDAQPAY